MKHLLPLGLLSLSLLAVSIKTNAQKSEEEAIKKTLQQESNSYFNKDYDGWANNWTHDSANYVINTGASAQSQLMGWDAISTEYKHSMENSSVTDDASIAPSLNKRDFHFYINGNVAIVSFKQGGLLPNIGTSTLIKQNGAWKIFNFTLINNGLYDIQSVMKVVNSFFGKYWMAK